MDPLNPTYKYMQMNRDLMKEIMWDKINNNMTYNSTDYICIREPQFI